MTPLIYLASPYSSADPAVREERYLAACDCVGRLTAQGRQVISPIAMFHTAAKRHDLPTTADFWEALDRRLLAACDCVFVLTLDGWESSRGIDIELRLANEMGKPVYKHEDQLP